MFLLPENNAVESFKGGNQEYDLRYECIYTVGILT